MKKRSQVNKHCKKKQKKTKEKLTYNNNNNNNDKQWKNLGVRLRKYERKTKKERNKSNSKK